MVDELWFEVYHVAGAAGVKKKNQGHCLTSQAISQCERYIKREFPNANLEIGKTRQKRQKICPGRFYAIRLSSLLRSAKFTVWNYWIGIQDNHPN